MQHVHYLLSTLTETPESRPYFKPHFTDEEVGALRDGTIYPRSPSESKLTWSSNPVLSDSKVKTSTNKMKLMLQMRAKLDLN